jgi:SAM-dependent methyltransferase
LGASSPPYAAGLPVATPGRMRRNPLLGGRRGAQPVAPPSDDARAAYAQVPYPGLAFPQSHPDRLATNARLMGMKPAAPERCRVLELGCGDGGNLIPMAAALEGSEFVGLDLEPSAIARATERAAALGAGNATFAVEDLATLDSEALGRFDYVIAHGVYSWVPRPVAERLLAVCRAVLEKQGVAYVSYNALPGGHLRALVWDAMRFHGREHAEPGDRLGAAREMLAVLAEGIPGDDPYQRFSAAYAERLGKRSDAVLYHDDLEPLNRPILFTDFLAEVEPHGLQYLAEADWFEMTPTRLPPAAAELLERSGQDRVAREQYLDFLKCRAYRQTLLCRDEVKLDAAPSVENVRALMAAAPVRPSSKRVDASDRSRVEFRTAKGATMTTDHPLLKAGLLVLGEAWPRRLSFEDVVAQAAELSGAAPDAAGERALADLWLRGYDANLIRLHSYAPPIAAVPGGRPRSSEVARRLLALGDETVTSLDHESVGLDERMRRLVELADGSRDREALARELGDVKRSRLDENLQVLAALALLEA